MTVTVRDSTLFTSSASTTTTVTVPSTVVDGDTLLLWVLSGSASMSVSGTYWGRVRGDLTSIASYLYVRRALTGDASTTFTLTHGGSTTVDGIILALTGQAPIRWLTFTSGNLVSGSTTGNTAIARNGDLVLSFGGSRATGAPTLTGAGTLISSRATSGVGGTAIYQQAITSDTTVNPSMTTASTANGTIDVLCVAPGPLTNVLQTTTLAATNAHKNGRIIKGRLTSTADDVAGA